MKKSQIWDVWYSLLKFHNLRIKPCSFLGRSTYPQCSRI